MLTCTFLNPNIPLLICAESAVRGHEAADYRGRQPSQPAQHPAALRGSQAPRAPAPVTADQHGGLALSHRLHQYTGAPTSPCPPYPASATRCVSRSSHCPAWSLLSTAASVSNNLPGLFPSAQSTVFAIPVWSVHHVHPCSPTAGVSATKPRHCESPAVPAVPSRPCSDVVPTARSATAASAAAILSI